MLFFGVSFVVGVVALLIVQKMDIECVNPRVAAPKRSLPPRTRFAGTMRRRLSLSKWAEQ